MLRRSTTLALSLALSALCAPPVVAATAVARSGDASIVHDEAAGTWALSSGGAKVTLALDAGRDLVLTSLTTPSGAVWTSGLPDATLRIGGQPLSIGTRGNGFALAGTTTDSNGNRLVLNATFDLNAGGLRVTRHYGIVAGAPVFETWTTYTPTTGTPTLADLNGLQIAIPNGSLHWVTGLQGDSADVESNGTFTLMQKSLGAGQSFTIGSERRASEQSVPWLAIDGARDEFFTAIMWSGAWNLTATRSGASVTLTAGLASMQTTVRGQIDGPHVVFGAATGSLTQATSALRSYIADGVRDGRSLSPLVTYNTWFAYGTEIDDPSMRAAMDQVSALGAELFVIDAGWYEGTGVSGPFDFDSGLGSWQADPARFPAGLRPLRDYAHGLGMKFGIWVEPERMNLANVADSGLDERLLATSGGEYGSDHAAQICFANAAARDWVLGRLRALLDEVQPDYLKWDNNMWVNCDRGGHDHGAGDGNFAHVTGLYTVLDTIRSEYPDLMIENVSGGGNRLDVGMLRYSDVAWMDDRTAPSVHVRHNVEGLSTVFPPAYLLSFVTDHEGEPLHDSPDLSLYMRSRMPGALGLCFRTDGFSEGDAASLSHEIAIYKGLRDTVSLAAGSLLTPQAATDGGDGGPAWDALQETAADGGQALICAYQSDDGVQTFNVKPIQLDPSGTYDVISVDSGALGSAKGSELMSSGIDVVQSPNTAAHIIRVVRQQ